MPLLALFGGAALWLVAGSVLALIASIKFHAPDFLAGCPVLTYGRVQPAADDALLYGFCIPAGLGVMLWLFAHLGQAPLRGAIVPVVAANLWHLGVFIGLAAILAGDSTGFAWLEFPRAGSVLLFFAYLLLALWADDELCRPPRARAVSRRTGFWSPRCSGFRGFTRRPICSWSPGRCAAWCRPSSAGGSPNNLVFIWLALVGIGTAFYFLPKYAGRPLQGYYLALYAFWMLILFGTWCGIPLGAPVPAWLPTISSFAAMMTLVPVLAVGRHHVANLARR